MQRESIQHESERHGGGNDNQRRDAARNREVIDEQPKQRSAGNELNDIGERKAKRRPPLNRHAENEPTLQRVAERDARRVGARIGKEICHHVHRSHEKRVRDDRIDGPDDKVADELDARPGRYHRRRAPVSTAARKSE
ncbi:MAG TPA: hypothetical protein VKV24_05245 [Casimicrobiaceae bacterium]|nr:hypothetical protein [Casimicrobiaceae bacterium]